MLAALAVIWLASSPRAGGPRQYSVAGSSPAFGVNAPGVLDDLPASGASELLGSLGLGSDADFQDYALGLLDELGAGWVRIDFRFDGKRFIVPGAYLEKLEANGIEVVACPRAPAPLDADSLAVYEKALSESVASHPSIRVWLIDSEFEAGAPDQERYLELFLAGSRAVRAACPDCRVGLAGPRMDGPAGQDTLAYYDSLLASLSGSEGARFDIFDVSCYGPAGAAGQLEATLSEYQGLLEKHGMEAGTRLWVTECATYSGQPADPPGLPAQSEEQQAAELVERFVALLGAGVERVAWAELYDLRSYGGIPGGFHDHSGLICNGLGGSCAAGDQKQAFGAYQLLIEKTRGFVGVSRLAPGQYRFDLGHGRDPVYVVWSAEGTALSPELEGPVRYTDINGYVYETSTLEPRDAPVFVHKL
ncbi:MAG: hypothetical protein C4534_07420 [Gaiellales bacterium]|nr:MAG: hypothetical protein C4534_07420 [Gaiellales bacterium]